MIRIRWEICSRIKIAADTYPHSLIAHECDEPQHTLVITCSPNFSTNSVIKMQSIVRYEIINWSCMRLGISGLWPLLLSLIISWCSCGFFYKVSNGVSMCVSIKLCVFQLEILLILIGYGMIWVVFNESTLISFNGNALVCMWQQQKWNAEFRNRCKQ